MDSRHFHAPACRFARTTLGKDKDPTGQWRIAILYPKGIHGKMHFVVARPLSIGMENAVEFFCKKHALNDGNTAQALVKYLKSAPSGRLCMHCGPKFPETKALKLEEKERKKQKEVDWRKILAYFLRDESPERDLIIRTSENPELLKKLATLKTPDEIFDYMLSQSTTDIIFANNFFFDAFIFGAANPDAIAIKPRYVESDEQKIAAEMEKVFRAVWDRQNKMERVDPIVVTASIAKYLDQQFVRADYWPKEFERPKLSFTGKERMYFSQLENLSNSTPPSKATINPKMLWLTIRSYFRLIVQLEISKASEEHPFEKFYPFEILGIVKRSKFAGALSEMTRESLDWYLYNKIFVPLFNEAYAFKAGFSLDEYTENQWIVANNKGWLARYRTQFTPENLSNANDAFWDDVEHKYASISPSGGQIYYYKKGDIPLLIKSIGETRKEFMLAKFVNERASMKWSPPPALLQYGMNINYPLLFALQIPRLPDMVLLSDYPDYSLEWKKYEPGKGKWGPLNPSFFYANESNVKTLLKTLIKQVNALHSMEMLHWNLTSQNVIVSPLSGDDYLIVNFKNARAANELARDEICLLQDELDQLYAKKHSYPLTIGDQENHVSNYVETLQKLNPVHGIYAMDYIIFLRILLRHYYSMKVKKEEKELKLIPIVQNLIGELNYGYVLAPFFNNENLMGENWASGGVRTTKYLPPERTEEEWELNRPEGLIYPRSPPFEQLLSELSSEGEEEISDADHLHDTFMTQFEQRKRDLEDDPSVENYAAILYMADVHIQYDLEPLLQKAQSVEEIGDINEKKIETERMIDEIQKHLKMTNTPKIRVPKSKVEESRKKHMERYKRMIQK